MDIPIPVEKPNIGLEMPHLEPMVWGTTGAAGTLVGNLKMKSRIILLGHRIFYSLVRQRWMSPYITIIMEPMLLSGKTRPCQTQGIPMNLSVKTYCSWIPLPVKTALLTQKVWDIKRWCSATRLT